MIDMADNRWLERQTTLSLDRLLPRLEAVFAECGGCPPRDQAIFLERVKTHFPRLFGLLLHLYGKRYDFFYYLEELLAALARSWIQRPAPLKRLDARREANPDWFQSNQMLGGVCYVDLFTGDLGGIREQIPYFKELGLTYLHLMPLFKSPEGENDGGYAVSSYREVNPALGTISQLARLATRLRENGISLALDFVFNHTSDEHRWAQAARAGDPDALEYYRTFPDRTMPDAYEKNLREIFPTERPGSFTYFPEMHRWVWTTFNSYQWDLNYSNPQVFNCMAEEMLFLGNIGVEVLRLDAVAFIWKELGTSCENLPEAHMLIQAFNAVARIAAPAMIFKSEAIVHPDDVARYISLDECQISYNPLLMALLWNTLATRDVRMLDQALRERFRISEGCAWVNYVRCHDDIGWTFSDEDVARLNVNGYNHRRFLNEFYTGRFAGSFARGLPFQENPRTGDARISGTCASLAGLEKALSEETERETALAVRRILLIHGVILFVGGIPLIYLGDEIGTLNDYDYRLDPAKASDSRWVHRPAAVPARFALRTDAGSLEGQIYQGLQKLIRIRKEEPAFAGSAMQVMNTGSQQVLGLVRSFGDRRVIVLANFSERQQVVQANLVRLYGLSYSYRDLISGEMMPLKEVVLEPYQMALLGS
jgi:glycosidase